MATTDTSIYSELRWLDLKHIPAGEFSGTKVEALVRWCHEDGTPDSMSCESGDSAAHLVRHLTGLDCTSFEIFTRTVRLTVSDWTPSA